ncbi:CDP-diacylglycerol--serine O-phosphatidyltransferase [Odoribacter sp. OttesenSCG-928-G04]|nr:CDP-diacylglycerol--serine O-phosphatidyltransferase [Odoribacter sp. OttesenSCG-928-G04]MDL2330925.1 CDP-diacylglycerol--serine O-phosphatidyltransferase [Odoribacter sp. OttesenSCG-928-A06]
MKRNIPNLITSLNVISGGMAIFMGVYGQIEYAAFFILLGMFFDFFDGLAARLLHVKSELGKELDSLADMLTFGMAPALLAHLLMRDILVSDASISGLPLYQQILLFVPLLIPAFSAYRLAKFNLDTRQTTSFIGLPTPANALFWVALVFSRLYVPEFYNLLFSNIWVLAICVLILSILLISELPMFSLKISGFSWLENKLVYTYFILLFAILAFFGWTVLIFIIPLYIFLCIVKALLMSKN